jgi:hypothetical protein
MRRRQHPERVELMAGRNYIPCIGPSYHLDDRKAAVQTAINCYIEQVEGLGETRTLTQVSAPGLASYLSLGAEVRGQRNVEGRWFVAAGGALLEIVDGAAIHRGTLSSAAGVVNMAHNNTQLVIVGGTGGDVFNLASNAIAPITSEGWRGSKSVGFIDGYTIFVAPGTDQFYITALDDASTMDALDFSSADAQPDNIVCALVLYRELVLLGLYTTEIWVNSGGAMFPLARYNSAQVDVGCVGKDAAIVAADSVFWIGQTRTGSGIVYRMAGHAPVRVSTRAIEQMLAKSTDIGAASMWTYQVDGHEFIGINAPGLETTLVYDAALQQWHERAEWQAGWAPLRVTSVCFVSGGQYAGDAAGNLYRIDPEVYAYGSDPMVRERTWPHMVKASMEPITFPGLELACTTGHGGAVTLELSNNGGFTFGPPLMRSLGAIGQWMQKVRWLMLGTAHDRVFRIRCSDPVPFNIHAVAVADA